VIANVRENLSVSKQAAHTFDVERFNIKKLSELEVRKQFQIKISLRFAALEILHYSEDIHRAWAWGNIKDNIKISAKENLGLHERKQHKPWFAEECSQFLDYRKHAKMQRLEDQNQSNVENLNN
jgi:hypothetical protein